MGDPEPTEDGRKGGTKENGLGGDPTEAFADSVGVEDMYNIEPSEIHGRKGVLQTTDYIRLFEGRISALEEELRALRKLTSVEESMEPKLEERFEVGAGGAGGARLRNPLPSPAPSGPRPELIYQTWEVFQGPETVANRAAVVEVLLGDPGIPKKEKEEPAVQKAKGRKISPERESEAKLPNRIRVHSPHILKMLKRVSSVNPRHEDSVVFLKPFKTLVHCEDNIREETKTLEEKINSAKNGEFTDEKKHISWQGEADPGVDEQGETHSTVRPGDKPDHIAPSPKEIHDAQEALDHARLLVQFIDGELKCLLDLRDRIANGSANTISFENLWLLFNPGDIVYSRGQAYEVLSTSGGQPLDKQKVHQYRQEVKVEEDGRHLYREHDTVSPFVVDCYSINFDGRKYGPVQKTFRISAYDGKRAIKGLPICPQRFFDESWRNYLRGRGKLFLTLTGDGFAHRQYDGLVSTPDGEREEINSRVIIDFTTALRMHPKWCPDLGLKGSSAGDPREITGCGGVSGNHEEFISCFYCYYDFIWEDHRLEQLRTSDYMERLDVKLRRLQHADDLTDDQIILLPDTVYGFVLRNRKWVAFTIDNIYNVIRTEENFNDLVIPSRHKRIVEALVKTHSREPKVAHLREPQIEEARHNNDLVRGKGEGIIMLLHGPPGVGKTSTAECVAELCDRPLFQITCGDIGVEPKDVEKNLDDNFRLAHRWGCVLLLDEADVFLTRRGQEDLKRNSLVSVFLRVLEYYPGILFLTTNRVGIFDEAFKSRIHVSLQYPKLNKESSMLIWENNIRRAKRRYEVREKKVMRFASETFEALHWNGRQIKNAFQVVIALAEFDALKNPKANQTSGSGEPRKIELKLKWFKKVTDVSTGFDLYIEKMYGGTEEDRALRSRYRFDEFRAEGYEENQKDQAHLKKTTLQKGMSLDDSSSSSSSSSSSPSSSDSSDEEPKKPKKKIHNKDYAKQRKEKAKASHGKTSAPKPSKKKDKKKKPASESEESDSENGDSSESSGEEKKKDENEVARVEEEEEEEEEEEVEEKKPRKKASRKPKK